MRLASLMLAMGLGLAALSFLDVHAGVAGPGCLEHAVAAAGLPAPPEGANFHRAQWPELTLRSTRYLVIAMLLHAFTDPMGVLANGGISDSATGSTQARVRVRLCGKAAAEAAPEAPSGADRKVEVTLLFISWEPCS